MRRVGGGLGQGHYICKLDGNHAIGRNSREGEATHDLYAVLARLLRPWSNTGKTRPPVGEASRKFEALGTNFRNCCGFSSMTPPYFEALGFMRLWNNLPPLSSSVPMNPYYLKTYRRLSQGGYTQ